MATMHCHLAITRWMVNALSYLQCPNQPCVSSSSDNADSILVAFWWVATTTNNDMASMDMHNADMNGYNIPVTMNSQQITHVTQLLKFQEAVPANNSTTKLKLDEQIDPAAPAYNSTTNLKLSEHAIDPATKNPRKIN